jgi:hypothetical protein
MILDKKFLGILDQETGVLVVFSKEVRDTTYDDVNETVTAMNKASLSVTFHRVADTHSFNRDPDPAF